MSHDMNTWVGNDPFNDGNLRPPLGCSAIDGEPHWNNLCRVQCGRDLTVRRVTETGCHCWKLLRRMAGE